METDFGRHIIAYVYSCNMYKQIFKVIHMDMPIFHPCIFVMCI